jgi:hypothetical protein
MLASIAPRAEVRCPVIVIVLIRRSPVCRVGVILPSGEERRRDGRSMLAISGRASGTAETGIWMSGNGRNSATPSGIMQS